MRTILTEKKANEDPCMVPKDVKVGRILILFWTSGL